MELLRPKETSRLSAEPGTKLQARRHTREEECHRLNSTYALFNSWFMEQTKMLDQTWLFSNNEKETTSKWLWTQSDLAETRRKCIRCVLYMGFGDILLRFWWLAVFRWSLQADTPNFDSHSWDPFSEEIIFSVMALKKSWKNLSAGKKVSLICIYVTVLGFELIFHLDVWVLWPCF